MSNSQLNRLKSRIKYGTKVTAKLSSNVVCDSNDYNNFPHKLLLTDTQKFQKVIYQKNLNYQKLNCIKSVNQEEF